MWNAPNTLTFLRLALIPIFVLAFYVLHDSAAHISTAALFGLAAITDWLDGYLARKLGQTSQFGAFLDPVADKLMVGVALVLLVSESPGALLAIPAVVIIGREIAISALREWMAQVGERAKVAVSYIGKVKTTVQMAALIMLLYRDPLIGIPIFEVGVLLLYLAALLTLWSMIIYLRAAWPALNQSD